MSSGSVSQRSLASARRLGCDTGLLTVLEDGQGNVLNIGRKTRTVSPALRRALTRRDHCCRFPGCTESRFVDAQQRCHIEFRRPDRQRLPESLYPQFAQHQAHEESLAIERQHQIMGLHIDQLTAITRWRGERLDYSMAIEAVLGVGSGMAA
ncbi:hypothetical protein E3V39_01415 [Gammaproteobacteria bacterium LSUCC0112]|nr:hypothetical protein E3V39_01415 [Gammaproteobacteria bacterium LSUCC0112]